MKQSLRQWYKRFNSFIATHNFIINSYDSCKYFRIGEGGSITYLLLYVHDMLIVAKDKVEVRKVKAQFCEKFEMKDLGAVRKILSIEILRDRKTGKLYLSKNGYIEKVLHMFNMLNAKAVSTTLTVHFKLSYGLCPQSNEEIDYIF